MDDIGGRWTTPSGERNSGSRKMAVGLASAIAGVEMIAPERRLYMTAETAKIQLSTQIPTMQRRDAGQDHKTATALWI